MLAAGMTLLAALAIIVIGADSEAADRADIERIREEQRNAPRRRRRLRRDMQSEI